VVACALYAYNFYLAISIGVEINCEQWMEDAEDIEKFSSVVVIVGLVVVMLLVVVMYVL